MQRQDFSRTSDIWLAPDHTYGVSLLPAFGHNLSAGIGAEHLINGREQPVLVDCTSSGTDDNIHLRQAAFFFDTLILGQAAADFAYPCPGARLAHK